MTNPMRLSLIGLCAVLALILVGELILTAPQSMGASARLPTGQEQFRQSDTKVASMVDELLKRPLFTPGRQPPRPPAPPPPQPPKLQGRLTGVVSLGTVREAVFTRPGGRPVSVKEGEVIDGWTMAKIEPGKVTLTSSFGEQVVKPTNGSPDETTAPAHRPVVKKTAPTKGAPKPGQTRTAQPAPPQQQQLSQAAARAGLIGSR